MQPSEHAPGSLLRQFRRMLFLVIGLLLLTLLLRFLAERSLLITQQQESQHVALLQVQVSTLLSAMLDQETGLRGYTLTADPRFLAPFHQGRPHYLAALAQIRLDVQALHFQQTFIALTQVEQRAAAWYTGFALRTLGELQAGDLTTPRSPSEVTRGKALFDQFRDSVASLQVTVNRDLVALQEREGLLIQSTTLGMTLLSLLIIVLLIMGFQRFAADLRRQLHILHQAAQQLAQGDLRTRVKPLKHRELLLVGQTLNQMAQQLQQQYEELLGRATLIERANEYWALLNTVNTALLFLSHQGQVLVANHCFTDFFGFTASELVGQPFENFFPRWAAFFADPSLLRASFPNEAALQREGHKTILLQVAPERRELELQILPVYALEQELRGFLYLLRDVTQERALDRLKSEFISTVSHEFRTALTGIAGFSELICEEASDVQEAREFASDIKADALRLSSVIANLLDLEHLQSGEKSLQMQETDLNALLQEVVQQAQQQSPHYRLRLLLDERLSAFPLDGQRIRQVLSNLLSNAIKYSPADTEIVISSQLEDTLVHIRVQDQGKGISAEALEWIFTPYNRIHASTTHFVEGASLGLPVVRQIVELHGGQAWAESAPGQGAILHFTLALQPTASAASG